MSDTERNKATAIRFITTMRDHAGGDESLLTDDHKWILPIQKACTVREIKAHFAMRAKESMPIMPTLTIVGLAAEGDRVALEAVGKCELNNGKRYDNAYHFVLEFRDGRICTIKEYCDTKLVIDTFGAPPPLWL